MNKKKMIIIAAIIISIIALLFACNKKDNKELPEVEETSVETTTEETTAPPKYTKDSKLIALTFDDGPGTTSTEKILKVLEENDSVATFFVVGYNLDEHPEIIKKGFDIGCEYGNHSKDHKKLTAIGESEIRSQIGYVNDAIERITGQRPVLCRAPGGFYSGITNVIGMPLIQWSIDTNDWKKKDATHKNRTAEQREKDIDAIVNHVITNAEKGSIVLMHDIYEFSADVCVKLIPKLKEEGYELVTVSEMFEAYGEELKSGNVYRQVEFNASTGNTLMVDPGTYIVATKSEDGLNLRTEADKTADVICTIPKGAQIVVTECKAGWARTAYEGQSGWVSTAYLTRVERKGDNQ